MNPTSNKTRARAAHMSGQGFSLIEVLVAMGIFAIGFAMIAGVVPAGHLLNLRAEDDVMGLMAGKNAAAVVEAKKIFAPAFEHAYMHNTISDGAYNAGAVSGNPADAQASARCGLARGLEGSFATLATNRPNDGDNMADFEDVLGNAPPGAWPANVWPASWPAFNGTCPGWAQSSLGFRSCSDTNGDGVTGDGSAAFPYADATDMPMGRIHAYHHRVGYGDALPSLDISYPNYAINPIDCAYLCTLVAADLNANASSRRFTALVAVLHHRQGDTWPERGTDPALGGCATGRAGSTGFRLSTPLQSGLLSVEGNPHPNSNAAADLGFWNTYCVGGTDTDPNMPGLYNLPMIVYDFNNNLIEAQYPPCWTPGAYTPFVSPSIDRRMAAGDLFIAREGGTVFTVLSTRDVVVGNSVDLRYQILEVTPPLNTTLLGPNASPNWRLRGGYFAPRAASGGRSPLVRVETISYQRGFTDNPNN